MTISKITNKIIASTTTVLIVLSLVLASTPLNAQSIQIENDRFTQYHIENQSTPNLEKSLSDFSVFNPTLQHKNQYYSNVNNTFNTSKTRHIYSHLNTQTINAEDQIAYFNYFTIANLGTKNVVIKNKDIINNDSIISSKINFPILQNLPQKEISWLSNRVCNLNTEKDNLFNTPNLLTNCTDYSNSNKDVVIEPGQFLLKVYFNLAEISPSFLSSPDGNVRKHLKRNDLINTEASVKIAGIGNKLVLKSLVSVGNQYDKFAPNPEDRWSQSTSTHEYNNKEWTYSTTDIVTPLAILSSIHWTQQ